MDPTVPPVLSLPGAVHAWIEGVDGVIFTPGASWLTLLGFHFTGSGVAATLMARRTQSSDWGRSGLRPPLPASDNLLPGGLFVKPDRTSRSNVPWNGSLTTLALTTSAPGLRFICGRHPSQSLERTFLFTVPAWTRHPNLAVPSCEAPSLGGWGTPGFPPEGELLPGLSRFCSVETLQHAPGMHTTPVCAPSTPSQVSRTCLGCDSTPESIASRCGRRSRYRTA